jgi:predicted TIM-barrel fold metal-dependent hydrolase
LFAIGASPPTWLDDPTTEPLWAVASELDLRIVVALLPPDLPRLRTRLEQFPGSPVVLDHCGFPDLAGGPPYSGAAALFALAGFGQLHLKVTSHLLEAADAEGDPSGRMLVEQLVATFGASRLVWGSDYPQTHDRSYGELVELGRSACARLSDADRALVMGANALRLWPALDE